MYWRRFSTGSRGWMGRFAGVVILCAMLVVGCQSPNPQSGAPGAGGNSSGNPNRITLGTTAKVRTLDPADSYEILSGNLLYNLGDRLYTTEPNQTTLVPQLATALPQISEDGLTYTIPLREGVVFHDGTPFNAEAMAFSLNRFIQNGGDPASLLGNLVNSVNATSPTELTIQLKAPFAAFPSILAFPGLCAVSPQSYEIGAGKFKPQEFVGTGPYKLAQYGNDSIRLDTNPDYWGEKPANEGVDIQIFASSSNLFNAAKTGAVDAAYQSLDPNQVKSLQENAALQTVESEGLGIHYLSVNVRSAPLDKPEVRQALALLIDRKLLSDRVFQGQVEPLYSLVPASVEGSKPVFEAGDGDADAAKALLEKAGFSEANPLQLDFWYRSNLSSNVQAANTIKAIADQKLPGLVQLKLQGVESATAYENLDKGAYPIFMLDWTPDYLDADSYLQPFMACEEGSAAAGCQSGESAYQGSFYYNDRVNQLIAQERTLTDAAARDKILIELQDILAKDVPFIPLWNSKDYLFVQKNVQGAAILPTSQIPFKALKKG